MNLFQLGQQLRKTGRINGKPLKLAPQRRADRMAGGWIADRVALGKSVLLCWRCNPKFDWRRNRYHVWQGGRWVNGECDGCKQLGNNHTLYLSEQQDMLRTRR